MDSPAPIEYHLNACRKQMASVIWRVLRDADRAEDALQEALLRIWRRRKQVAAHPNPSALMLRMCYQVAIDRYRQHARRRTETLPFDFPASAHSTLDTMMIGEAHRTVLDALSDLPAQQGQAVYLRVIEQLPYDDVAAALDCTPTTARGHVRRARQSLRHRLGKLLPDEVCHESS